MNEDHDISEADEMDEVDEANILQIRAFKMLCMIRSTVAEVRTHYLLDTADILASLSLILIELPIGNRPVGITLRYEYDI